MFKDIVLEVCPNATFEEIEVKKNNTTMKGIKVNIGKFFAPVFYDVDKMSKEAIVQALETALDKDDIENADVTMHALNIETNKDLLATVEHEVVCDLAIVKRAVFNMDGKVSSGILPKGSDKEIIPWVIRDVGDIVGGAPEGSMYCVTNKYNMYGSGVFADTDFLKECHEKFGDFYILPSSVHEVLFVPVSDCINAAELKDMVKEVNATMPITDILSSNVYKFFGEKVEIIGG